MLEYLGGKCAFCGLTNDLEIDHKNPQEKSFTLTNFWHLSNDKLKIELQKCQLLCKNCHKFKTMEMDGFKTDHGKIAMYKHHGCRCKLCKDNYNKYMREYKSSK